MNTVPEGLNPEADIGIDEDGNLVLVVRGQAATFNVSSERLRKFAQDLAEAALRRDLKG